tara:strand:+ start:198 stop:902 length:705 start_codon:yes stop_codon:yes gene_type:complete
MGRKRTRKVYFGMEVQDAIVRYNSLDPDENQSERNTIYSKEIHPAFDKLCENIINTFKFTYFDDPFVDVKHETVAFLVTNMHKYDHTKGSKAFSYFSVVAKNYLILHNNANYKKYCTHSDISTIKHNMGIDDKKQEHFIEFIIELIDYFEDNVPVMFKNKRDIDVAYAIIELLKKRDEIENFNKKALYVLIREMTNIETSYITKVVNRFKKEYKNLVNRYESVGTIVDNKNSFF